MNKILFSIFFLCSTLPLHAGPNWKDPHWLQLLHYKKTLSGNYLSQADGEKFFLSPNGKNSPEAELKALIDALSVSESDEKNNVYCRFPARIRWLQKQGYQHFPQKIECKELDGYREQIAARSVSVVFSSYFIDNPVSSFGHIFLRLSKDQSPELLDTGVNFAAQTGDAGMFEYVVKGLTGGFPGEFRAVPYYIKVQEYNDSEQRDLWSYELDLSQEEIDYLVDHLWEMRENHFDYYFLTENCSYHVLTLLEASRPDLRLSDKTSSMFVIPAETLKLIHQSGLVKSISFRPSPQKIFKEHLETLTEGDRHKVRELLDDPTTDLPEDQTRAAQILDAALARLDLEQGQMNKKRQLMIKRAKIPVRSPKKSHEKKLNLAPHFGHGSSRVSLGGLNRDDKSWMTLGFRVAQNDILDNDTSYLPGTSLEILDFTGRSDGKNFQVEQFSLLNMLNLRNISDFDSPLSWKVRIGGWRDFYRGREEQEYGIAGGMGVAKNFHSVTGYVIAHVDSSYHASAAKNTIGVGGDFGALWRLSPALKFHSLYGLRDYAQNESFWQNEIRYSNHDLGVGAKDVYYLEDHHHTLILSSFLYF